MRGGDEWEEHRTGQDASALRFSLSHLTCVMVAALMSVGCNPASNPHLASPNDLSLVVMDGSARSVSDSLSGVDYAFFTCGCDPCVKVGAILTRSELRMACISFLPESEFRIFLKKVSWDAPALRDPDCRLMVRLRAMDCPVVLSLRESGLPRVDVAKLSSMATTRRLE